MAEKPSPATPPNEPAPEKIKEPGPAPVPEKEPEKEADPTRYGDWERNGRCIDF